MRLNTLARWAVPPLMGLILYWPGLMAWFQKDDFAWLGLYQMIHQPADLLDVLFHPYAQGTIRTISERVFYTSFFAMFGMNALPYRIWAFLTYVAATVLLGIVTGKLTGSNLAGSCAAILWTVNSCLGYALSWTAIYYELLCSVVFLGALWLLMKYQETGARRYLIWEWIVYLLGFGVLEQNVVWPAIAAVYALCFAPRLLRQVLPMFIPALIYTGVHLWAAPMQSSGPYRMHVDPSMFQTLANYWKFTLGPSRLILFHIYPSPWRSALTVAMTVGLFCYLIQQARKRHWIPLFGLAWFVIVLLPLLPLRDHFSEYYITIPAIGLAIWAADALARRSVAAILLAAVYIAINIPLAHVTVVSFYDRSQEIRTMVERVLAATRGQQDPVVVLQNVDREMYESAILHRPFRLYGINQVYSLPQNGGPPAVTGPVVTVDLAKRP